MDFVGQISTRASIIGEVFSFLWQRKLWWLIPLAIMILLLGMLFAMGQISSVAPWMYPL